MRKVHFKISFDPFNGRIEVAEFKARKFFTDEFHHLFYTHTITRFGNAYFS